MILTLNRNIKRDTSLFGGKICGLISILEMGLPTPPGVIISSKLFSMVFENYFPQVKDDYSLENIQNIGLEKIRETLLDCEIPLSARMSIEARISIIEAPHGFSIRSSATNEDSTTTSMAGIFLTLLSQKNLTDVLSSLRQIWSSLFTELSLNYLRTMGITQLPKMAVLIQKQIYPDVSGVAFTTNPDSGNFREILINAACGMCSGVVGGISDTDTYRINKSYGGILTLGQREITHKKVYINEECEPAKIPDELFSGGTFPLLSDLQLLQLGEILLRIELHHRLPQDVEWALKNNQFILLQSRPVTTKFRHYVPEVFKKCENKFLIRSIFPFNDEPTLPLFDDLIAKGAGNFLSECLNFSEQPIQLTKISGRMYISIPLTEKTDVFQNSGVLSTMIQQKMQPNLGLFQKIKTNLRQYFSGRNTYSEIVLSPPQLLQELDARLEEYRNSFLLINPDLHQLQRHLKFIDAGFRGKLSELYKSEDVTEEPSKVRRLNEYFVNFFTRLQRYVTLSGMRADILPWLQFHEIAQVLDCSHELRTAIDMRRIETEFYSEFACPPEVITSDQPVTITLSNRPTLIKGIGVAGGRVKGNVLRLHENLLPNQIPDNAILICPYASLQCSEYFGRIKGLAVEDERTLSHSIILAREMNIPTVTGLRNLYHLVDNGDEILIDGTSGYIEFQS